MTTNTDSSAAAAPSVADQAIAARRAANEARTAAVRAEFRHDLNVAYGRHPKQILDIYYPKQATTAPVLVFVHGGGFNRGDPGSNGYNGRAALEHGAIFISMGYRLAPDARFPDSCKDIERGLRWVRDRIGARGGDPERVYLSGHSAGAMLSAAIGLQRWSDGCDFADDFVKGLVLISGIYDIANHSEETINRGSKRYVPRLHEAIERLPGHTIVVAGDNDLPLCMPGAEALVAAIRARGGSVEMFVEADADHFAANKGFISADGAVFQSTRRMMGLR